MATLIVLAGLPAAGKSTLARALARETGAVWLRIDSIEQAIRASGVAPGPLDDAGYRAAWAVAEDNLRLGRDVIGDSVNPWMLTRDAWRAAGERAGAEIIEVEVVCSDPAAHRRRVETRAADIPGLVLPGWDSVARRDYRPWDRERLTIDTTVLDAPRAVGVILAALRGAGWNALDAGA